MALGARWSGVLLSRLIDDLGKTEPVNEVECTSSRAQGQPSRRFSHLCHVQ